MPTPVHRFSHRHRVLVTTTFIAVLIAGGLAIAVKVLADAAADASIRTLAEQAVAGCNRNQVARAYLKLRSREVESPTARWAKGYFQIVNCEASYSGDRRTVYLAPRDERCYLRLVQTAGFGRRAENASTSPSRLRQLCRG